MSAGNERKPDDPENQTPLNPESGWSRQSPAGEPDSSRRSPAPAGEADLSSGDTEGLPPDQPLPSAAELLRRASGSSVDSFSGEGQDLSLLVAEQFQRRYAHFEVEIGPDGKPVELGRGAMGITYKASDTTLRRPVALKVISSRLLHNESLKNRFLREARAAASLRHPYVASIYYLGSTEASYFYAMELIEGQTLEAYISQHGPLEVKLALEITIQIASALAAAHQAGLVHRDIKPANIILTRESHGQLTAKVIDFGLVKFATGDMEESSASEPGIFLGTPRYASPEQISCGPVDIRSDLYSVGVTLWQMLTKSAPFMGTPSEVAAQHLQAPLPISKLRHFPQSVVALLSHLLEKDPKDRPQTPDDLLAVLRATQRSLGGPRILKPAMPVSPDKPKRFSLRKSYVIGGGAFLIAIGLGAYVFFYSTTPAPLVSEKSVAVLPIDNVGGDKQNDYLSDGLTTEVIFQLSKIGNLRVISRDSVLEYKATPGVPRKSLEDIGKELSVETILESSIQRLNDQVKIIAVLYDAKSGKRLWGAAYNREFKDLFSIETDVAENLSSALKIHLTSDQRERIQRKPTDNLTAYDIYLQAQACYELRLREDNERAIELFRRALELDPKFAPAYAALANCYIERNIRYGEASFWLDSAIDVSERAIAIDPSQVRAHIALARAFTLKALPEQARDAVDKALQLAPNDAEVNFRAASQLAYSDPEAYHLMRKAHTLSPNDPRAPYLLAQMCTIVGEAGLREKWMRKAISLESDTDRRRMLEAEQLVFQGEYRSALAALKSLPPGLTTYGSPVFELMVVCSERLNDGAAVLEMMNTEAANAYSDEWRLFYTIQGLLETGDVSGTREDARRLQGLARSSFSVNGHDQLAGYYLAFSDRVLGQKDEAFKVLRQIFPRIIDALPLFRADPSLDVFATDNEFQDLMRAFEAKNAETRKRINDDEKSSN
jgi:TolB-like protein/Tfp pilus assembly protein PilF